MQAWLRERLEEVSIRQVGREVGTSGSVVRAAIRRHGIERPPWRATPLERAQWEPDPVVRYELAARIAAEAKATRAEAQRTLRAAERIMRKHAARARRAVVPQTPGPRRGVPWAHRWVRSIGKRAGLGSVHPHMLRAGFIMAALDAGVPLRDVQIAACHADPRTTTIYDRRRENFDRHAAYVVAFVVGG